MKAKKEQTERLRDLQASLDVSIYETRSMVASWLDNSSDDQEDQEATPEKSHQATATRAEFLKREVDLDDLRNAGQPKARDVFQGRPNRLGLGAVPPPRPTAAEFMGAGQTVATTLIHSSGPAMKKAPENAATANFRRKLIGRRDPAAGSKPSFRDPTFRTGHHGEKNVASDSSSDEEDSRSRSFQVTEPTTTTSTGRPNAKSTRRAGATTGSGKGHVRGDFLSQYLGSGPGKKRKTG
ncbi:hypothetical protein IWQ60_001281 [Tieghemiomyces parasiticus]|uniref:Uncharacterized protein n=1 Tax=Tieghemiomyces parasiticus TaxID=78921 RepID=A0A9W8E224_9FUNG|nr:hypothetical protein IWQ60_001281 [Tieghemiomyces parasiticus]